MTFSELVSSARAYLNEFDYDRYPENFRRFEADAKPLFDALTTEKSAALAAATVADLAACLASLPWRARRNAAFEDKQILGLFLSPAAQRHSKTAAAFSEQLRVLWCGQYPRNIYLASTYEQIMKGFDANLLGLPLRKSKKR